MTANIDIIDEIIAAYNSISVQEIWTVAKFLIIKTPVVPK